MNTALLTAYQRSANLLHLNLESLTHENSLWTPAANVNSINWLTGHLVAGRMGIQRALNQEPVWDEEARVRYQNGSDPINADGEGVRTLEDLIALFDETQTRIENGLKALTPDALDGPSQHQRFPTLGDQILYHYAHEIHHLGQIVTLRELIGLPGVWA